MDVYEFYEKHGHWPTPEELLSLYVKEEKKPVKKQAKKKKTIKKKKK